MKNLMVNHLYIFSPSEKRAKHIAFSSGINIITSSKVDGNKKGKSVILKSIYHTLGADSFFDDKWNSNSKVYVLQFSIGEIKYFICRHARLFKIFDFEGNLLFKTVARKELAKYLGGLFDFSVKLPNRTDDRLEITSPVYNYILNYVDQDKMDGTRFNSFRDLGEYKNYKANTVYYHLGVFDEKYYVIIKDIEKTQSEEEMLSKEHDSIHQLINRVRDTIEDADVPSSDFSVLQRDLSEYTEEYNTIVYDLRKTRNSLIKLRNSHEEASQMLNSLRKCNKQIESDIQKLNNHLCPYCSSVLGDTTSYRIVKYSDSEDIHILTFDLEAQIIELENKILDTEKRYQQISEKLQSYEDRIEVDKNQVSDILKAKALREILDKFKLDLGTVEDKLANNSLRLEVLKKQKKEYDIKKRQVNKKYSELMTADRLSFGLQEIDTKRFDNIELTFEAGGSNKPIATVIWYFNLLRLKTEFNKDSIRFPVVLDSPNNVELDDGKRQELFKYLFANSDENTQMIISTLGFAKEDYPNIKIDNVIDLKNPKYSLLSQEEYVENLKVLFMCDYS